MARILGIDIQPGAVHATLVRSAFRTTEVLQYLELRRPPPLTSAPPFAPVVPVGPLAPRLDLPDGSARPPPDAAHAPVESDESLLGIIR